MLTYEHFETFSKGVLGINSGGTFLLLLKWNGEVVRRLAVIEMKNRCLEGARRERRTFKLE